MARPRNAKAIMRRARSGAPVIIYGNPPAHGAPDFGDRQVIYMTKKQSDSGMDGTTVLLLLMLLLLIVIGVLGYVYRDKIKEKIEELKKK